MYLLEHHDTVWISILPGTCDADILSLSALKPFFPKFLHLEEIVYPEKKLSFSTTTVPSASIKEVLLLHGFVLFF